MKKIILVLAAFTLTLSMLAACERANNTNTKPETEEKNEVATVAPTAQPTEEPTVEPTDEPTVQPTETPTVAPTEKESEEQTEADWGLGEVPLT